MVGFMAALCDRTGYKNNDVFACFHCLCHDLFPEKKKVYYVKLKSAKGSDLMWSSCTAYKENTTTQKELFFSLFVMINMEQLLFSIIRIVEVPLIEQIEG